MRRLVTGVATAGLNRFLPSLYKTLETKDGFVEALEALLSQTKLCPADDALRDALLTEDLYGPGDKLERVRYILERLEMDGQKERVELADLTIEHVLPQKLTDAWRAMLGTDAEALHDELLHTLGNLTLTGVNSELGNRPFEEKRTHFANSKVTLNRHFTNVTRWDAQAIRARGAALADRALELWPAFGRLRDLDEAEVDTDSSERVTGSTPTSVTIGESTYEVRSWAEVTLRTLEHITREIPDGLAVIEAAMPRFVNRDLDSFGRTSQLVALPGGFYVNKLGSARHHYRSCQRATDVVGLEDVWRVAHARSLRVTPEQAAVVERSSDPSVPTPTQTLQLEFWTALYAELDPRNVWTGCTRPRPQYWLPVSLGTGAAASEMLASPLHGRFGIRLRLGEKAAQLWPDFERDKAQLETLLGFPLEYRGPETGKRPRIAAYVDGHLEDRAAWPMIFEWFASRIEGFRLVLVPRLRGYGDEAQASDALA